MEIIEKSKYCSELPNIIMECTNFDEQGLAYIVRDYTIDPFKAYLSNKYNEYFAGCKKCNFSKYNFTFDEVSNFFDKIATKTGQRHPLIDLQKNGNIISLWYNGDGNTTNIRFRLAKNEMFLQDEWIGSVAWPYSEAKTLMDIYLNKVSRNSEPNKLIYTDIIFDHCRS